MAGKNRDMNTASPRNLRKLSILVGLRKIIWILAASVCVIAFFYPVFLRNILVGDLVTPEQQHLISSANWAVIVSLLVAIVVMFIEDIIQFNSKR
jgi:hypothetical protein